MIKTSLPFLICSGLGINVNEVVLKKIPRTKISRHKRTDTVEATAGLSAKDLE